MTTQLTDKEIKELVIAYVEYKKAKDRFDELKKKLTADLIPGKYESKFGQVTKTVFDKEITDWKQLIKDNPNLDVDKYTEKRETTMVFIQNLNTASGILG